MVPNNQTHQNIWIIDDDPSVRQSLQRLLKIHGFHVKAFSSGEEAVHSEGMASVNCLILDVCMPMESGLEVFEKMQRSGCRAPAVFITAHTGSPQAGRAGKSGTLVRKPFDASTILSAISSVTCP